MPVKFGPQERPRSVVIDKSTATSTYAKFIVEPFERVFGHSVGNALRRVLLTFLETPGILSFRLEGVPHEFMAVDGIVEDVTSIALAIKGGLLRRLPSDETSSSREVRFVTSIIDVTQEQLDQHKGKYPVTFGAVMQGSPFEVVNPDMVLFTVTKPMKRQMDFRVGYGRGYIPAERHRIQNKMEGEIILDTIFSPVILANYAVENTRVGQDTDYDRLVLEITTDGRLSPTEALSFAAQILMRNLEVFMQIQEHELLFEQPSSETNDDDLLLDKLALHINEIELSVRSTNCLAGAEIETIGELVCLTEKRLLEYRNFGKKSLNEIKAKLIDMGLGLGMDLSRFGITNENVKERMKEIEEERKSKKKREKKEKV